MAERERGRWAARSAGGDEAAWRGRGNERRPPRRSRLAAAPIGARGTTAALVVTTVGLWRMDPESPAPVAD